jgi:hypothetical protein
MTKMKWTFSILGVLVAGLLITSSASGQTSQWVTYVSSAGDNANLCTRSQPCKTINNAMSKTFAGGEVNVLDAGNYEFVSINKAITINGNNLATLQLPTGFSPLPNSAITINAGADETVLIRGFSITTASNVANGIEYQRGLHVIIENCTISGRFVIGIKAEPSTAGNLLVQNTSIQMQTTGFSTDRGIKTGTTDTSVLLKTVLENVRITGRTIGLEVVNGNVSVKDSLFTHNGIGILNTVGQLTLESSRIISNTGTGIQSDFGANRLFNVNIMYNPTGIQANAGSVFRLSDVSIMSNATGIAIQSGAPVCSFGNNKIVDNGTTAPPNVTCPRQ